MKKFALYLTIVSILLFTLPAYAESPEYQLQNPKTYLVSKTYEIKNNGAEGINDVKLDLLIGRENTFTYQKDLKIEYDPEPYRTTTDRLGNVYANYEYDCLNSGEKLEINITREAISSDMECNIDTTKLTDEKIDAEKFSMYLQPSTRIESNDPSIMAKARQCVEGKTDDYSKARAIFEFVNKYMTYDESDGYKNKGALAALTTGRGVCEDYATLFAALCRASGIPARVAEGYKLSDNFDEFKDGQWKDVSLKGHNWAEFYLAGFGWVPVEPTVLYTLNGSREVYWDGFAKLDSSMYVSTGLYNPLKNDIELAWVYSKGSQRDVVMEPIKEMIKLEDSQETDTAVVQNTLKGNLQVNTRFKDVDESNWAYNYINSVMEKGIIKGYEDSTFRPNKNISRIEFMVMLSRMLKFLEYESNTGEKYVFKDYPPNHWSEDEYDYLAGCLEKIEPSSGGLAGQASLTRVFNDAIEVDRSITRGEAVALFDKFLADYNNHDNVFTDINNSKFESSILKAYDNGIVNGYSDNSFKPGNNITRSEAAKLFDTYLKMHNVES